MTLSSANCATVTTGHRFEWTKMIFWAYVCMLAFVLPHSVQAQAKMPQLNVSEIIQNVRSNEELYQNIEVIFHKEYRLRNQADWIMDNAITSSDGTHRTVLQNGMLFSSNYEKKTFSESKTNQRTRLHAYDGEKTRVINGRIVNIHVGKVGNPYQFRPHTWLLSLARMSFPLSLWLQGGEELQLQPFAGIYRDLIQDVTFEKVEELDGIQCFVLRSVLCGKQSPKEVDTIRYVWLAPEKNYLPVKTVGYAPAYSKEMPLEVGIASTFREIAPGISLPFRYEITVYDEYALRSMNKHIVSNSEVGVIEKAELNPQYPTSFFRDIPIPDDAIVYEIKDGVIVNSYDSRKASIFFSLWFWFIFAVGIVFLVWVLIRRFRVIRSM